jgi:RNA polymerase sigma factor (sigma-70 family)
MPFPQGVAARAVPDKELVIAFKTGDPDAYDEMYRRYRHRVSSVCSRLLINHADAEEATQETFLRAYQALPRFNGNYKLGAWLTKIATNVSLDQLRSRNRTNLVALPSEEDLLGAEEGPEDEIESSDPRLDVAMSRLRPIHARALQLRAVEELSHEEIAGHLAMTAPQVKTLLHRARASFKRAWSRAEAMALVPLLFLRDRLHRHSFLEETTTRLSSTAPVVAPQVAEKVAASAIVVMAAISGLGAVSDVGTTDTLPDRHVVVAAPDRTRSHTLDIGSPYSVASPNTSVRSANEATVDVTQVLDDVKKVVDRVPEPPADHDDPPPPPDDDDGDILGPHAAEAGQKITEAQATVNELLP